MGATKLKEFFNEREIDFSDPPKPPRWVATDKRLLVRNMGCAARITKHEMTTNLNGRIIDGIWYVLEFYISKKILQLIIREIK